MELSDNQKAVIAFAEDPHNRKRINDTSEDILWINWRGPGTKLAARSIWRRLKEKSRTETSAGENALSLTVQGDSAEAESRSSRIKTLDDLIKAAQIDLTIWTIDRYKINKWEVGAKNSNGEIITEPLWQVVAYLKKKVETVEDHIQPLIDILRKHAYKYPKFKRPALRTAGHYLLEISPADLHYGMLAWGQETGEDYDSHISRERFNWAIEDLLNKASPYPVEEILLLVGNDLFHSDQTIEGKGGATTYGTPQDVDTRWQKNYQGVEHLIISTIDRLLQIAPVNAIFIPGNHDATKVFYLGQTVAAWYHRCKDVSIDNTPQTRKYKSYGVQLLGFTHGGDFKEDRLPLLMAQEVPQLWAQSKFREWHTANYHKKKEVRYFPVIEEGGVRVRILPTLCSPDSWHYAHGFTGNIRAAEAYLWEKNSGFAAEFSATLNLG